MNSNIDFDLYKMFYNVVNAGSFSKAAEDLYISQSAVTQSIQRLEDQIGGILFIRSRKGATLTESGKALYNYIESSLKTLENAEDIFSKYQNMELGTIKIASGSTTGKIILKNSLTKFTKDYPNIKISIESMRTSEAIEKLATGYFDIVLLNIVDNIEYDNVKIIELYNTSDIFFTNKDYYKTIKNKEITLKELQNYKLALPFKGSNSRMLLDERASKHHIKLEANYSFTSGGLMIDFVKKANAIGYIGKLSIQKELEEKSLIEVNVGLKESKRRLGIACLDKKITNMATIKLIEYIKNESIEK